MGNKRKRKKVEITCGECGKTYYKRTRKPGADGIFRCQTCRNRAQRKRFKEKTGKTPYEHYQKGNPKSAKTRRAWQLKNYYGLTLECYDRLLSLQGGVCAICKQPPKEGKNLPVDHDHLTGQVRGLLCHPCNRAIGQLQDDGKILSSATSYLMRHNPARSWDRYFLDMAYLAATRSKDPSSQVGAVIVRDRNIISTGYNGFPRGVNDNISERYQRPEKYLWMVHAEENAILNASKNGVSTSEATLYVVPFAPCTNCTKGIIQSGIKEVVIDSSITNPRWVEDFREARTMLEAARVIVRGPE